MTRPRLELLLLDFDGVLARYERQARCAHLAATAGCTPARVAEVLFGSGLEAAYDSGALDTGDYLRRLDGSEPRDRVRRAGYESRLTGENIALGPESAEEVVAGWLDSPGHCANIMDARFQDIGVGVATGRGRGQIYWVQNFGVPKP